MAKRVLISGAGVAGLSAALWLARGGVEVVVVEKAKSQRIGGYIVGLAGQAYQDAQELGVMPVLKQRDGGVIRSRYLDAKGRTLLRLDYRRLYEGVDVIQMMRDDMVDGVYEVAQHHADIRFGDTITNLNQDAGGIDVSFASGKSERFDAVIGADGQHSNTRGLAFEATDVQFRHLGLMCAAYRLPNVLGLEQMFETHMEQTRYMAVFSTRDGDMGAVFIWQCDDPAAPASDQRREKLLSAFGNPPVATARVLEHCPSDTLFYMDPTVQNLMDRWHRGRVALIGDAAHSLTLFSGRGAAAAFADAGYLGRAMTEYPLGQAFSVFEAARLPHLRNIQDATKGAIRWYVPGTAPRHFVRNASMALLPSRLFEAYFHHKYSTV